MSSRRIVAVLNGLGIAMILAALFLAPASLSWASVSFDVSVGLPIGDDAKLFLNVTNEYYAPPMEVATAVVRRCPRPEDDFPAILFLASASGRSPAEILQFRLSGHSWSAIMYSLHVAPSVLFVGMDRDPGPPYGRAWGYWRNHPRGRFDVSDRDFVELTKLQVASAYYRVSPYTVVAERRRGVTVERFAADRHYRPEQGRKGSASHAAKPGKPHGNPHNH